MKIDVMKNAPLNNLNDNSRAVRKLHATKINRKR